jgi:general L-amino acid transport system permease protein
MSETWRPKPSLPSPSLGKEYALWSRTHLFSTPGYAILTLLSIAFLAWTMPPLIRWALLDATWLGDSRVVCDIASADGTAGTCWVFIKVRMGVFLYGFYPLVERWRINFTFFILAVALLPLFAPILLQKNIRRVALYLAATIIVLFFYGIIPAAFIFRYLFAPFVLHRLFQRKPFLELFSNQLLAIFAGIGSAFLMGLIVYYVVLSSLDDKAASPIGLPALVLTIFLLFVSRLTTAGWHWVLLFTVYPVFAFFMLVGDVFGPPFVETHFSGGLFLTLVMAGTGMATALPIGILLALGRRSSLPGIKALCVAFIEFVRGVPLV